MYGLEREYFSYASLARKIFLFCHKTNCKYKRFSCRSLFLSLDTLEEVNQCIKKELIAGGIEPHPMRDYGFMQQRTLEEFDGHSWEIFTMDVTKFPQS